MRRRLFLVLMYVSVGLGVLATAPFHWNGDMKDMRHLMSDVFSGRMAGPSLAADESDALGRWLDRLPAMPALPVGWLTAQADGTRRLEIGISSTTAGPRSSVPGRIAGRQKTGVSSPWSRMRSRACRDTGW